MPTQENTKGVPGSFAETFELFKNAPTKHAMQNDLDMTTLVASMILWLEQVNKVVHGVGKFSKNPAMQAFSPKIDAYIQALNDILEHQKELSISEAPSIKR